MNGEAYRMNTLKKIVYCIWMFLHAKCVFWFLLDNSDVTFLDVIYVLDNENEMKHRMSEELEWCYHPHLQVILKDKLWKVGKLGDENGHQLVDSFVSFRGEFRS